MKKKFHSKIQYKKHQRGVVLMVVLTTIVFLTMIVQQMTFDTAVEFKSGASHFQGLKAYHAAQSGLEITLLKISIYKKIQDLLVPKEGEDNSVQETLSKQVQPILSLLWKTPLNWPPVISEDTSEVIRDEIQDQTQESFLKDVKYYVEVENESSKLNVNDLASPHLSIRNWAQNTLLQLLTLARNQEPWLSYHYDEQDLRDILDKVQQHLNPTTSYMTDAVPLKRRLMSLDELKMIQGVRSEWVEFLRPYLTVHSSGGIHLQFAKKLLLQSLVEDGIQENQMEELLLKLDLNQEEGTYLSDLEQAINVFATEGIFIREQYSAELANVPALGHLVFNFNAPQNFKIKATGISGDIERTILATIHDPYSSISRIYQLMSDIREKSGYTPPDTSSLSQEQLLSTPMKEDDFPSTPFIIEWKDVSS